MQKVVFLILILASLSSCLPDPPEIPRFNSGIFVSNEGPFLSGTGSVSFIDRTDGSVTNDAFFEVNDGESLGNIVQSLARTSDDLVVVVNNADKLVFANIDDMTKSGEVTGLQQPRYAILIDAETLAVSEWGERGGDGIGRISFIDVASREIESQVAIGRGPEKMIIQDGKLYVCNSGGFGQDSTVSILDIDTRSLDSTIVVGPNPQSMVPDAFGAIYVLCSGVPDFTDPAANIPGALVRWDDSGVEEVLELPTGASDITTDNLRSRAYFLNRDGLQEHVYGSTTSQTIRTGSYYECVIDPLTGNILLADPGDFISRGGVLIVDRASGETIDEFQVGVIPGGFLAR